MHQSLFVEDASPLINETTPSPLALNHQSNEIEALQKRLAHAQRQISTLKGSLMREKLVRMSAQGLELASNGADPQEEGEEGKEYADPGSALTAAAASRSDYAHEGAPLSGPEYVPHPVPSPAHPRPHALVFPNPYLNMSQWPIDPTKAEQNAFASRSMGPTSPNTPTTDKTGKEILFLPPYKVPRHPTDEKILRLLNSRAPMQSSWSNGRHHPQRSPESEQPLAVISTTDEGARGPRWHESKIQEDNAFATSTSQLPHSSDNQQATISGQSVSFFSSARNMTIIGGSYQLNVYSMPRPGPDGSNSVDPSPDTFSTTGRHTNMVSNSIDVATMAGGNSQPTPQPTLIVSDDLLGIGSCGTVVFRGSLQGRPVAVKKLLRQFVTLAEREVSILRESDSHPNVIKYYYQEARDNFLFIAIELCPASLADIIEKPDRAQWKDIVVNFDPKKALEEITSGLDHLHSLNVVHRDIKPQNILISAGQGTTSRNGKSRASHRMLISDFGLCKKLDDDQTSFLPTTHGGSAAGTRGWQAPEILRMKLEKGWILAAKDIVGNAENTPLAQRTLSKSMDIFPLGCLFYYTLTKGRHPFGAEFEREVNILRDDKDLSGVEIFGEEAKNLSMAMLNPDPNQRPDTATCLEHPYFM